MPDINDDMNDTRDRNGERVSMRANKDDRFMKTTNILILATLLIMTGFLGLLYFRMGSPTGSHVPQPQVAAVVQPVPVIVAPEPPAPAPKPAQARSTPRPSATRNYTQPVSRAAAANPAPAVPEPVRTAADIYPAPQPALVTPPAPPIYSAPAYEPPQPVVHTIPSGTILTVRMIDSVQSDRNRTGDRFTASLDEPIFANGVVIVPRGATVEGHVVNTQEAGRVSGVAELAVQLDRLTVNGRNIDLVTETVAQQGETSKRSDAVKVGAASAIGAVIGAISGGGKGAAIGAATGAGAGTAGVLVTRGKPAILEPESRLNFQLRSPIEIEGPARGAQMYSDTQTPAPGAWDSGRPQLHRRNQGGVSGGNLRGL